uniref:U1-type domain-containing protein n=1 Tax=Opuntia streptacantha TaxID=393608 RepID=A0A7C9D9F2_OPUST
MAWCELCRVDCNTLEILEQHKNGKRHKKNLKLQEELHNLSKQLSVENPQVPLPKSKPETLPSEPVPKGIKSESEAGGKSEPSGAPPSEGSIRKDRTGVRGGFKRKMRGGGRGGKSMRAYDGSRRPVEPPKPKQMVPIICDLCNVKCESQVVFESHVAGKKHLANVKRFQSHKEAFGEGIQALYPTIPNLPSTSIIPQANQEVPQEAYALASTMLSPYNLPDPQAARTALAQLLHQHGIHDAQTLIAQLVPYLLAQFQAPGSLAVPTAGLGLLDSQKTQTQAPQLSTAAGKQHSAASAEAQALQNQVDGPPEANSDGAGPDPSVPELTAANGGECNKQSN